MSSRWLVAHSSVAVPGEYASLGSRAVGDELALVVEALEEAARQVRGRVAGVQKEGESGSICEEGPAAGDKSTVGGMDAGPSIGNEGDRLAIVGVMGAEVDAVSYVEALDRGLRSEGGVIE